MRTFKETRSAPATTFGRCSARDARPSRRRQTLVTRLLLLTLLCAFFAVTAHATTTIDTTPGPTTISCFIQTESYGQTITVPTNTDTALTSFTFMVNLNAGAVRGMVYAWDDVNKRATGPKLYDSGPAAVNTGGTYQQLTYNTGGIPLVPGAKYIIFATRAYDTQTSGCGGNFQFYNTSSYAGGEFFFTNGTSPTTTNWNAFTGTDLAFKAVFNPPAVTVNAGQFLISEFRLAGTDEFIELYNNTDTAIPTAGMTLEASSGTTITVPAATVPARGHLLLTRSAAWSLAAYAAPDATYTADLPHNAGLRLKSATGVVLDTVAFSTTGVAGYGEGTALAPTGDTTDQIAWVRDLSTGRPKDTSNNASDFVLVSTAGTSYNGVQSRLGAPGPENTTSPLDRTSKFPIFLLDSTKSASASPNRERDTTPDAANNSTFGTMTIRHRFTNNTGGAVTRLRFRVAIITGSPVTDGTLADLRVRSSTDTSVGGIGDAGTCSPSATPCTVTVRGLTVESPSAANNGGLNSSLAVAAVTTAPVSFDDAAAVVGPSLDDSKESGADADSDGATPIGPPAESDTITLDTPLANGASLNVQFLFGVQKTGRFRFYVLVEALP